MDENETSWLKNMRRDELDDSNMSAKASIVTVDGNQDRLSFLTRDKMDDFQQSTDDYRSIQNEGKRSIARILKNSLSLSNKHAKLSMSYRMQSVLDQSADSSMLDVM